MSGSITGTQTNDFAVHARDQVSVTLQIGNTGSFQIFGFTDEDDCIQIRQTDPDITYTKGLYGQTSANLDTNQNGEVILKLRATSDDNQRIAEWKRRTRAGDVQPGTIIISDANYQHSAFNCLVAKAADAQPGTSEDPSIEWTLLAGNVELWKKVSG